MQTSINWAFRSGCRNEFFLLYMWKLKARSKCWRKLTHMPYLLKLHVHLKELKVCSSPSAPHPKANRILITQQKAKAEQVNTSWVTDACPSSFQLISKVSRNSIAEVEIRCVLLGQWGVYFFNLPIYGSSPKDITGSTTALSWSWKCLKTTDFVTPLRLHPSHFGSKCALPPKFISWSSKPTMWLYSRKGL